MNADALLKRLLAHPAESEWLEWKVNDCEPQEIGEYASALSNVAALNSKDAGFLIWGIQDGSGKVVGTSFRPHAAKVGNQELENWLATQLEPATSFRFHELTSDGEDVVILEVAAATSTPVRFRGTEFIRVGSYKKKLKDHPDRERELWQVFSTNLFEMQIALSGASSDDVISLLDYPEFFSLTRQSLPDNRTAIFERLTQERFVIEHPDGTFDITNYGAILFAKDLSKFNRLSRKALRVVIYSGNNRVETVREQTGTKGYAVGFDGAINFINNQLPQNEQVGPAFRREVRMYPEIAVRELVANAIIHQDFSITGTGPIVEIFNDRIEITNPGTPLVDTMRFIDSPPRSRNENIAAFMRRINLCEERGSGIDKVIFHVELFQLPPPDFRETDTHTLAVLYAPRKLAQMTENERVRACYQHACLCLVSNQQMTNASLRKRFAITDKNYPAASRIIAATIEAGLIKPHDPENRSRKHARYVPFWA